MTPTRYVAAQDCFDFIKTLQDGSVDLFLTDPPYMGIVEDSWDNQWKSVKDYVDWMYRVLEAIKPKMKENGSVIFFGGIGKHGERPFFSLLQKIEENNLFHYRNLITWAKRRAYGKMISLDTELPTPSGFVLLRDLREGDQLFDETGAVCRVTKLHPIDNAPVSFKVTFDDGSFVHACADHLWTTYTKKERKNRSNPNVRSTLEILNTLRVGSKKEPTHSIPCCEPVEYSAKELPIDPYLLGLWLGDGTSQSGCITSADSEVLSEIEHHLIPSSFGKSKAALYRVEGLTTKLSKLGLLNNKHIPASYMNGSVAQRFALLQGLMDTDGSCGQNGQLEFSSSNENLALQVHELMCSLGLKARLIKRESWLNGVRHKDNFRIWCMTNKPIFRLSRKLARIENWAEKPQKTRSTQRYIVNIEPIESVPMRCITVDSPNSLFLVTRNFIPTHNSHDYLFCREEIAWYSMSPERTKVTFNIPLTNIKRGYAGWNPKYKAKSEYKRVSNVWTDIPELQRPERQAQKPIPLMNRLIETHSNMGDLVVDCFAGWGTTGVSALSLKRRFLGCEASVEDAKAANNRCRAVVGLPPE